MKNLWILAFLMIGVSAMATPGSSQPASYDLGFAGVAAQAHCKFTQGPRTPDESKMSLEWMDGPAGTRAEAPGVFAVDLFMPGMGHGSSPTQIQRILDEEGQPVLGAYEISNMYFVMAGKWQVNVTLNNANGTKETKTIDVDVPGSMTHHH